jgi:hypothetical protein
MKTTRFLAFSAISIALAFTFSGCSSDDDGDDNPGGGYGSGPAASEQLYERACEWAENDVRTCTYTEANISGAISFSIDGEEEDVLLDAGSVTGGTVNFQYPATVPDEYLREIKDFTASPADLRWFRTDELYLQTSSGGYDMSIDVLKNGERLDGEGVRWLYLNKAGKVTGSVVEKGQTITFNLNAGAGWSRIYIKGTSNTITFSSDPSTLSAGVELRWYHY